MKLIITEKQLKYLVLALTEQDINEQDATPEDAEPKSGASDDQVGGSPPPPGGTEGGYPDTHKWESGRTVGPSNDPTNSVWPSHNQQPKRGVANPLYKY